MRDKSRNDCQSLVLAWKCVCQTPPPCAGAVSKGISPKGGAFSPPYGVSPSGWPISRCWRPCWTESMLCALQVCPATQPSSLPCGQMRCESSHTSLRKSWLELLLIRALPPHKTWNIFPQRRSLIFCYCRERNTQKQNDFFFEIPIGAGSKSQSDSSSHSSSSTPTDIC